MQQTTSTTITRKLLEIQNMGVLALQAKFQELYGYPTPQTKVATLRKRLAFRIQELFYGGLSEDEKETLEKIADADSLATLKKNSNGETPLMPGSRLVRTWKGKLYEVTVMADNRFEFEGRIYRSLSGVASEITGSHWNGKNFFGVK